MKFKKTYIGYPTSISDLIAGNSTKLIYRACVPAAACPTSFGLYVATLGFSISCCSGNLCNAATTTKITMTSATLPVLAALAYLRK